MKALVDASSKEKVLLGTSFILYQCTLMSQLENTRKQSCHHANKLNSYATARHFCAGDVATAAVIAQDWNKTLSKYLNSFFQ